jgi:hypothetical protein
MFIILIFLLSYSIENKQSTTKSAICIIKNMLKPIFSTKQNERMTKINQMTTMKADDDTGVGTDGVLKLDSN